MGRLCGQTRLKVRQDVINPFDRDFVVSLCFESISLRFVLNIKDCLVYTGFKLVQSNT